MAVVHATLTRCVRHHLREVEAALAVAHGGRHAAEAGRVRLLVRVRERVERVEVRGPAARRLQLHCPGRKPPFLAVKHPARTHKSAIHTRCTVKHAKGA
jgi:hypothetical protein